MTNNIYYSHPGKVGSRLILLSIEDNLGIFEDVSTPNRDRVKCPMTPAYIIPYRERSEVKGGPYEG